MKIIADNHIPFVKEYFGACGDLVLKAGRSITNNDVKDADMLLVRSITHVDEALLANSKVKFVASITAGADHLDTKWLDAQGIAWCNAHGFNAPPVADYVVSVIAALERRGQLQRKNMKAAVIGVGNVGKLVNERLQSLGFDVVLCDPLRAEHESNFHSVSMSEIADVDLITVHVPLIRSGLYPTYHFINKEFLQQQKLGCVLINASRGSVINSQDLIEHGAHLHWCFDVWEHEPKINMDVFADALLATPHIAGYSVQSKMRGTEMIYRIACEKNMISPQNVATIEMPQQHLPFAGDKHHWQDIVLGIFNPMVMTAMMRTNLAAAKDDGHAFDEMRNHFNYRHEFAYTTIEGVTLADDEKKLLESLGCKFAG